MKWKIYEEKVEKFRDKSFAEKIGMVSRLRINFDGGSIRAFFPRSRKVKLLELIN